MDRTEWTPRDLARAEIVEATIARLAGADLTTLSVGALAQADVDLDLLVLDPAQPRADGSPEAKRHELLCAIAQEVGRRRQSGLVTREDWLDPRRAARAHYRATRPDLAVGP